MMTIEQFIDALDEVRPLGWRLDGSGIRHQTAGRMWCPIVALANTRGCAFFDGDEYDDAGAALGLDEDDRNDIVDAVDRAVFPLVQFPAHDAADLRALRKRIIKKLAVR